MNIWRCFVAGNGSRTVIGSWGRAVSANRHSAFYACGPALLLSQHEILRVLPVRIGVFFYYSSSSFPSSILIFFVRRKLSMRVECKLSSVFKISYSFLFYCYKTRLKKSSFSRHRSKKMIRVTLCRVIQKYFFQWCFTSPFFALNCHCLQFFSSEFLSINRMGYNKPKFM